MRPKLYTANLRIFLKPLTPRRSRRELEISQRYDIATILGSENCPKRCICNTQEFIAKKTGRNTATNSSGINHFSFPVSSFTISYCDLIHEKLSRKNRPWGVREP